MLSQLPSHFTLLTFNMPAWGVPLILPMRQLSFREAKGPARGHTASEWHSWGLKPELPGSPLCLIGACHESRFDSVIRTKSGRVSAFEVVII